MSDLHIEFEPSYWERIERRVRWGDPSLAAEALERRKALLLEPGHPAEGPDLRDLKANGVHALLLPGDIHLGTNSIAYADAAARYLGCAAYICAGNHEGYGRDLLVLIPALREAAARTDARVSFLERGRCTVEIRGRRLAILGATLWTDYRANGDEKLAMIVASRMLNDHRLIGHGGSRFTPAHARAIHLETREWLGREALRVRDEADVVVIMTHHAPIPDANPQQHRGGELGPAFVSDLRAEILKWQPDVWAWGHTHYSMCGRLGRTELVSAQRGYIGQEESAERFVPLVITI